VVLRMVFGRRDLERVRVAGAADPLWELVLAMQMVQTRAVSEPFVAWRQATGHRLGGVGRGRPAMSLLRGLVPPSGNFPDFLTPYHLVKTIDAGCEAVACTGRARLAADLAATFAGRPAPPWARLLARGDRGLLAEVVRAVRTGHDLIVAPHWDEVRPVVAADRARRSRQLVSCGPDELLPSLPGVLGWDGQVLRTRYPEDRTVDLAGRGLMLLPSYFCWGNPITWIDPELPPVLVYQAHGSVVRGDADVEVPARLVSLLGRTRAECLGLLLTPHTTSELAQRLGTSVGTASKQATVLRAAGLIASTRRGGAVVHNTTSLGIALLIGELPD
jgi:DNA-binding transcriptional ArsR family regulator